MHGCVLRKAEHQHRRREMSPVREFLASETGATALEYSLIAALIAIAIIGIAVSVGTEVKATFEDTQAGLAGR